MHRSRDNKSGGRASPNDYILVNLHMSRCPVDRTRGDHNAQCACVSDPDRACLLQWAKPVPVSFDR